MLNDDYLCIVALVESQIAGWLAGSWKSTILSEHGCSFEEFYIEEIVVDSRYRKLGIGSFLLSKIRMDNLKSIVVDTPLINEQAIAFYEHIGFVKVNGLTEEFSRNWTWMLKIVWKHMSTCLISIDRHKHSFCFQYQLRGSQGVLFLCSWLSCIYRFSNCKAELPWAVWHSETDSYWQYRFSPEFFQSRLCPIFPGYWLTTQSTWLRNQAIFSLFLTSSVV